MKVEKNIILLDDEIVDLNNVAIIDIVKLGSPFNLPQFCLSIVYIDGTNRHLDITIHRDRFKVLKHLNMLGEEIQYRLNDNFTNIGFALLNMDNIDSVDYNQNKSAVEVKMGKGFVSSFKASEKQAERAITRYYDAYDQYTKISQITK